MLCFIVPATRSVFVRFAAMAEDKIVAVALLTQRDLDVIGTGLDRIFRIETSEEFDDLLAKLDTVDLRADRDPGAHLRP